MIDEEKNRELRDDVRRLDDAACTGVAQYSLPLVRRFAQANNPAAQSALVKIYASGQGSVAPDRELYDYWLKRLTDLAEAGGSRAQWSLKESYWFGDEL